MADTASVWLVFNKKKDPKQRIPIDHKVTELVFSLKLKKRVGKMHALGRDLKMFQAECHSSYWADIKKNYRIHEVQDMDFENKTSCLTIPL